MGKGYAGPVTPPYKVSNAIGVTLLGYLPAPQPCRITPSDDDFRVQVVENLQISTSCTFFTFRYPLDYISLVALRHGLHHYFAPLASTSLSGIQNACTDPYSTNYILGCCWHDAVGSNMDVMFGDVWYIRRGFWMCTEMFGCAGK
jgi:hypothetical protein